MSDKTNYSRLSVYLCLLLRHKPEDAGLDMDVHGWVDVAQLIRNVNALGKYKISKEVLDEIVQNDDKGRYRYNDTQTKIKACQGHSVSWVVPELSYDIHLPKFLYHGTTTKALKLIEQSGHISKMKRHCVHLQAEKVKAWQSAERWNNATPVLLKIDAERMRQDGFGIGVSENGVWLVNDIPTKYIVERIYVKN